MDKLSPHYLYWSLDNQLCDGLQKQIWLWRFTLQTNLFLLFELNASFIKEREKFRPLNLLNSNLRCQFFEDFKNDQIIT